eukprot:7383661-Prymnesium_polylepis.1
MQLPPLKPSSPTSSSSYPLSPSSPTSFSSYPLPPSSPTSFSSYPLPPSLSTVNSYESDRDFTSECTPDWLRVAAKSQASVATQDGMLQTLNEQLDVVRERQRNDVLSVMLNLLNRGAPRSAAILLQSAWRRCTAMLALSRYSSSVRLLQR